MKILTLNCGSSSVKYALFDMPKKIRLCHGIVNRINLGRSFIEHYNHDSQKYIYDHECPNHTIAIKLVTDLLVSQENGVISSLFDIDAVGHRVVHGGQEFTKPVIINKEIERKIDKYSSLAPLHNPVNLAGIRATMQLMPNIPNAAIFDTAFFATLPAHVYIYGLPYEWYVKYGIRKYGFHGT